VKEAIPDDRGAWPHLQKNLLSPPVRCNDQTDRVGFNSTTMQWRRN